MKKITFFLTSALFMAAGTFKAKADSYNYTPYIGADYTYTHTSARGFNPHHHAAGVYIGSNYGKYFSTELFAHQSNRDKRSGNTDNIRTSYYNYGLDIMAYLPLFSTNVSLIATTGVGEYVYKTKFSPTNRHDEHGYGYRFGGGFKYAFNEHWKARFVARYVNFDKLSGYAHASEYGLGIEYHF